MADENESESFDYTRIFTDENGGGMFSLKFGDSSMADSLEGKIATKQVEPDSGGSSITPTGSDDYEALSDDTGPVIRANERMSYLGSVGMEALSLQNYEVSKAVNRLADEAFRHNFPILKPAVDEPNEAQKERVEDTFRSVNDAGQSLHGLLKMVVQDHARLGTGMVVVRQSYSALDGEIVDESVDELVRGDPKVIRPVTDENNQVGGLWACPIHRERVHEEAKECECGVACREVTYAKTESTESENIEEVYFDNEIISFSFYNTRLHGRDGLSPVSGIWKQAHILEQMRNYVGKFFDDDTGNRYPDKLLFVTTSNADAFEKQAKQAKDNRQESPYEEGILFFENTELDVQVVDMMSSEIMGQSESIKKEYKSDIRSAFGLTDVVDSAEDGSSMARGTKQVDVMSRSIQALRTDLEREVLPEIERVFDLDDWELTFEEEQDDEEKVGIDKKAEAIQRLAEAGQSYRIENGDIVLTDTDEETVEEEPDVDV